MPELDIYFAYQITLFKLGWGQILPTLYYVLAPPTFAPSGIAVSRASTLSDENFLRIPKSSALPNNLLLTEEVILIRLYVVEFLRIP